MSFLLPLAAHDKITLKNAGSRGFALAQSIKLGIPLPRGFVVPVGREKVLTVQAEVQKFLGEINASRYVVALSPVPEDGAVSRDLNRKVYSRLLPSEVGDLVNRLPSEVAIVVQEEVRPVLKGTASLGTVVHVPDVDSHLVELARVLHDIEEVEDRAAQVDWVVTEDGRLLITGGLPFATAEYL